MRGVPPGHLQQFWDLIIGDPLLDGLAEAKGIWAVTAAGFQDPRIRTEHLFQEKVKGLFWIGPI
ncbi:hypothetical protein GCM10008949_23620 [Deinococcus humi]|nr:hypothetical protein GCM10008949_23620 [Deinococcus humi]